MHMYVCMCAFIQLLTLEALTMDVLVKNKNHKHFRIRNKHVQCEGKKRAFQSFSMLTVAGKSSCMREERSKNQFGYVVMCRHRHVPSWQTRSTRTTKVSCLETRTQFYVVMCTHVCNIDKILNKNNQEKFSFVHKEHSEIHFRYVVIAQMTSPQEEQHIYSKTHAYTDV